MTDGYGGFHPPFLHSAVMSSFSLAPTDVGAILFLMFLAFFLFSLKQDSEYDLFDPEKKRFLPADGKAELRRALRARRAAQLARENGGWLRPWYLWLCFVRQHRLQRHLWKLLKPQDPSFIAAFVPMPGEFDLSRLMTRLHRHGWQVLLPCIVEGENALRFRHWAPGVEMTQGKYGIWEPAAGEPEGIPKLMLMPLLGFDRFGNRLGQGAGWYDRTLEALRHQGYKPLKVGVAGEDQAVEFIRPAAHDFPMNAVVTPMAIIRFAAQTVNY